MLKLIPLTVQRAISNPGEKLALDAFERKLQIKVSVQGLILIPGEKSALGAVWTKSQTARSIYEYVSTVFVIFVQNVPKDGFSVLRSDQLRKIAF